MKINDSDFSRLVFFVREKYGINLEHKRQLVDARLSFHVSKLGYNDFTRYVSSVISNPGGNECRDMINRLSTNYTYFFREPDYIEQMCKTALADIISQGKSKIRIWCAACSSGQEAYSVGMVLERQRHIHKDAFDFEIIGTDINTEMLAAAAAGVYDCSELERIPVVYRNMITLEKENSFGIREELKRKIEWRHENLLDISENEGNYEIIFCRNVMIYFTPQLRRQMTEKLSAALTDGGYLYTGTTESIDLERKYFKYIAPAFYKKSGGRNS